MAEPMLDLSSILGLYKEDARRSVDQMRDAVDRQWDAIAAGGTAAGLVRKRAHQLRGSGRTYGFRDVTRIAKAIERLMIKLDAKKISADDRLRAILANCVQRLAVIFD